MLCPVRATGKRKGSCLVMFARGTGMRARHDGPTWRVHDEICGAYCCKVAVGLGPDLEKERERKRNKKTVGKENQLGKSERVTGR